MILSLPHAFAVERKGFRSPSKGNSIGAESLSLTLAGPVVDPAHCRVTDMMIGSVNQPRLGASIGKKRAFSAYSPISYIFFQL